MVVTTILVAFSGTGVSEYLESGAYNLSTNSYRNTVHGVADFLQGLVDVGVIAGSGCVYTAASGINTDTLGGLGAVRYPFKIGR